MEKERKYVTSKSLGDTVSIINHKGEFLGDIEYHKRWKKHIFVPIHDTFYDSLCLRQIAKLLDARK